MQAHDQKYRKRDEERLFRNATLPQSSFFDNYQDPFNKREKKGKVLSFFHSERATGITTRLVSVCLSTSAERERVRVSTRRYQRLGIILLIGGIFFMTLGFLFPKETRQKNITTSASLTCTSNRFH
jgi:hypothetical protein